MVAMTPLPDEMVGWMALIFCFDCEESSSIPYRPDFNKCPNCSSYNTRIDETNRAQNPFSFSNPTPSSSSFFPTMLEQEEEEEELEIEANNEDVMFQQEGEFVQGGGGGGEDVEEFMEEKDEDLADLI